MSRKQAILSEVTAAREDARLEIDVLSLEDRRQFYDLEAALDTVEHRLQSGREDVTEALLHEARDLARSLRQLTSQRAA